MRNIADTVPSILVSLIILRNYGLHDKLCYAIM